MTMQSLMSTPSRCLVVSGAVAVSLVAVAVPTISGQTASAGQPARSRQVARLPFGQPNMQGVWNFSLGTPLERPDELAGKAVLTEEEASKYAEALARALDHDTPEGAERSCKGTGNYNEVWYERGKSLGKLRRTSLIVDPPDGKIPPLTAEGQKRREARAAARRGRGPADSWEDRGLPERCIIGFNSGPPMMPSAYNNNMQIFQTADQFVILNEMVHDARIIPLDGRPHHSSRIRGWAGDSRGRWEGDTMVIETTNFNEKNTFRGAGPQLRLIEKFTRVDADTLMYEVTVDDPSTFTRPWTLQLAMRPGDGHIYEYACHEGNYGLAAILSGARAEEKKAAEAANQKR